MALSPDSHATADADQAPEYVHDRVIPVVVETLEIQRVADQTGTVRVRKVVHEVPDTTDVSGMQESVETVRVPMNRVVEVAVGPHQRGDILVVPVYEERWVRQVVLLEEVHVSKRRTVIAQGDAVALRREEIVVERLDPATSQWLPEPTR